MPVIAALAVLSGIVTLLAFCGRWWWMFDLIASFRPQLVLVLAVLAGALALRRWSRTATFTVAVLGINLAVVLPLFIPPERPSQADFRILSFNLLWENPNLEQVIDYIKESKADLVILLETTALWEEALAAAGLPYELTGTRSAEAIFGSVVLAPKDAVVESFGFGRSDPRAVAVALENGIHVLAIHPLSPYTQARAEKRNEQFRFASQWVGEQPGPVIVVGDFNAGPWSYPFRRLVSDTGLHDSARGFGLELSYPAEAIPLIQVSIDHLLYSDGLAVVDRRLGPSLGSDHLPLTVDLAVSPNG